MTQLSQENEDIDDKENYLAALDIGSNSFHFVMARQLGDHLQIVHSEKYRVQLAQGLDERNILNQRAIERCVSTLSHLSTTTQHLNESNFRVVATYTVRQAKNAKELINAAAKVFPFAIEVISGHEEARLIYQGVAHHSPNEKKQLVIDIGGGSTECIIGKKHEIKRLDSLNMGCVSYQKRFFPTSAITKKAFSLAIQSAKHEVDAIAKRFNKVGWQHVIGTSGTIKAVWRIINHSNEISRPVTIDDLNTLKQQLIAFGDVDSINLPSLKDNRRGVLCSGVAILIALFDSLQLSQLDFCKYALREGVLFEQLDTLNNLNVRTRTIDNLLQRFNIDQQHANTAAELALKMLTLVKNEWKIAAPIYQELLTSAVKLHEVGMDINASGYQKHGQYILEYADLAGFNQEQQKALAWLVGSQRKKITLLAPEQWHILPTDKLAKLCIITRLTVLLIQQRHTDNHFLLGMNINTNDSTLELILSRDWLLARPIIDTELFYEQSAIEKLGFTLLVKSQ